MRRLTDRHRAVHDAEARGLLGLPERAVPHSASQAMPGVGVGKHYDFTPYAATQEYAMLPVSSCDGPGARLHLTTFPQIRNIMHTEFDSMGPARALSLLTGDELLPTTELVQELAFYLRRRVEEIRAGEGAFRRTAVEQGGAAAAGGFEVPFSMETPVVCFFGNGRLAWLLNNSGLLPFPVVPVGSPAHAAARERRQRHLLARDGFVAELSGSGVIGGGFSTVFPCESISVLDAMRKYRPCLVVVEPHTDRDWLCDLRGFYTTREVLLLGPVDSPAMCSFAFPFLSFGVTPGPTTYWIYNDMLQRAAVADRIRMPMDPPHVSQGYARHAVDNISSYLLSPNDCCAFSNQYRCISFVRKVYPVIKGCAGEGALAPLWKQAHHGRLVLRNRTRVYTGYVVLRCASTPCSFRYHPAPSSHR
ncbi:hypothetical protein ERJ75_000026800 [Trypanosoma vivax]|nr:hypothetical protein ERJ75_000026800 [Trypanosoma vivax]